MQVFSFLGVFQPRFEYIICVSLARNVEFRMKYGLNGRG